MSEDYQDLDFTSPFVQASLKSVEKAVVKPSKPDPKTPKALIIKGGGVKGLAYIGAIEELQKIYQFNWYVGTSAGAITAILLGAGYTLEELREISEKKDFRDFFDAGRLRSLVNLVRYGGLYTADAFTSWIDELLSMKLHSPIKVTLGKLPQRVTIFASRKGTTYLCYDSIENPDVPAAYAARCSMSIPFVFVPQRTYGDDTFDGGLQNNYPVKAFLEKFPGTDFIGLYLGPQEYNSSKQQWWANLLSILVGSGDTESLERYLDRTVVIDPSPVGTLDFGLSENDNAFLDASGREGALAFIDRTTLGYHRARAKKMDLRLAAIDERCVAAIRKRRRSLFFLALLIAAPVAIWFWHAHRVQPDVIQSGSRPTKREVVKKQPALIKVVGLPTVDSPYAKKRTYHIPVENMGELPGRITAAAAIMRQRPDPETHPDKIYFAAGADALTNLDLANSKSSKTLDQPITPGSPVTLTWEDESGRELEPKDDMQLDFIGMFTYDNGDGGIEKGTFEFVLYPKNNNWGPDRNSLNYRPGDARNKQ